MSAVLTVQPGIMCYSSLGSLTQPVGKAYLLMEQKGKEEQVVTGEKAGIPVNDSFIH